MIEFLLMVSISCQDGWQIIDRVMKQEYLSPKDKIEIIREIKEVMDCDEKTYERREGKTVSL